MSIFSDLLALINKFTPSRKASLAKQLNDLTVQYAEALSKGDDTLAASLKKQLDELRKRATFSGGDI